MPLSAAERCAIIVELWFIALALLPKGSRGDSAVDEAELKESDEAESVRELQAGQCPIPFAVRGFISAVPPCGLTCGPIKLSPRQACRFNASACDTPTEPGGICRVECLAPFVGSPSTANCPGNNKQVGGEPVWKPPTCTLPLDKCTAPGLGEILPAGYVRSSDGKSFVCATGYSGEATPHCDADDHCSYQFTLAGCSRLKSCRIPQVDKCQYNLTECGSGLDAGQSCIVRCQKPYSGLAAAAVCDPTNTDFERGVFLVEAQCTLGCPVPTDVPLGYRVVDGQWQCIPGYGGVAKTTCAVSKECYSWMLFSGCSPLRQCKLPPHDVCKYSFLSCTNLLANETCAVTCSPPYFMLPNSKPGVGRCPENNINPEQRLLWTPPSCEMECGGLQDVPSGYVSFPYMMTDVGWRCQPGYSGDVYVSCGTNADCSLQLSLVGCLDLSKCAPLRLSGADKCAFDPDDCFQVSAGGLCQVRCRAPFAGQPTEGSCPENNVDPSKSVDWPKPDCSVWQCPDPPGGTPRGYKKTPGIVGVRRDTYSCDLGYTGVPIFKCEINPDTCGVATKLSGCISLSLCLAPPAARNSLCWMDWSECINGILPGRTCEVRCQAPYEGNSSSSYCPTDNVNASRIMDWSTPECGITCKDIYNTTAGLVNGKPQLYLPEGYNKTEWQCEDGYTPADSGAYASCEVNEVCEKGIVFRGCEKVMPCAAPMLSDYDACFINISGCENLPPGGSCMVGCRQGLKNVFGVTLPAYCPVDNTNDTNEVMWVPPRCELQCLDPDPIPYGYKKLPSGCWVCAETHGGIVTAECVMDVLGGCVQRLLLSGCSEHVPCSLPAFVDFVSKCRDNASSVKSLLPGRTGNVTCNPPYKDMPGTLPGVLTCPGDNVDSSAPPQWTSYPNCSLVCPDPDPVPYGYEKTDINVRWRCVEGYIGFAVVVCSVNEDCVPTTTLMGCKSVVPCTIPTVDLCMVDLTDCGTSGFYINPGTNCVLTCKAPYGLRPGFTNGFLKCSQTNTDPRGGLFQAPVCQLGCASIGYAVDGYAATMYGWDCAPGYYGGPVSVTCKAATRMGNVPYRVTCEAIPVLSGCIMLTNCAPLMLKGPDDCLYQTTPECESVPSGIPPALSYCVVKCKAPYFGVDSKATCPALNADPSTQLIWTQETKPRCNCQDPNPWPLGLAPFNYVQPMTAEVLTKNVMIKFSSPLYELNVGIKSLRTVVDAFYEKIIARNKLQLSGRRDAEAVQQWDSIIRNLSSTMEIIAAKWVQLGLKESVSPPFSFAWECAPKYVGSVISNCSVFPNCSSSLQMTGCTTTQPCSRPVLRGVEQCMYVMSECPQSLMSGSGCPVFCKPPYDDRSNESSYSLECPADNQEKDIPLKVGLKCGLTCNNENLVPPVGYSKGAWRCANGYVGNVRESCGWRNLTAPDGSRLPENCTADIRLDGCLRLQPCRPLVLTGVDNCLYDVSNCQYVMPGGFCTISCRGQTLTTTISGASVRAFCPPGNTDRNRRLVYVLPKCTPECSTPQVEIPGSYIMTNNCGLQCGPLHWGVATTNCQFSEKDYNLTTSCKLLSFYSGCLLKRQCIAPRTTSYDTCRYNFSSCTQGQPVNPGYECKVECRAPWSGGIGGAYCPGGNVQAFAELTWTEPTPACSVACQRPPFLPEGYKQGVVINTLFERTNFDFCVGIGNHDAGSIWHTSSGALIFGDSMQEVVYKIPTNPFPGNLLDNLNTYMVPTNFRGGVFVGMPSTGRFVICATCTAADLHVGVLGVDGSMSSPAAAAQLSKPFVGTCLWLSSSANQLLCYDGVDVHFWNTTRLTQDLVFHRSVRIVGPPPLPSNQVSRTVGRFAYDGVYFFIPHFDPACMMNYSVYDQMNGRREGVFGLSGCVAGLYFDWGVQRYSSSSFGGVTGQLLCSDCTLYGAKSQSLDDWECWTKPQDVGVWRCEDGYIGEAYVRCEADAANSCAISLNFSGCAKLMACLPPAIPADKACMFDVSRCEVVMPGSSCEITCVKGVYHGISVTGSCKFQNAMANQTLYLPDGLPNCTLQCPAPAFPPFAYDKNLSGDWMDWLCSPLAVGNAKARCEIKPDTCQGETVLSGCNLVQPCAPVLTDACRYDTRDCDGLEPGRSCVLMCNQAFVGGTTNGTCPVDNIVVGSPVNWSKPLRCDCLSPEKPPAGYIPRDIILQGSSGGLSPVNVTSISAQWKCDIGYTGMPSVACDCQGSLSFKGCLQIVACKAPHRTYLTNPENCSSVNSGEACKADCLKISCVLGGPLTFRCPALNTDAFRNLTKEMGQCSVVCEVCAASGIVDTDPRPGLLTGKIKFGPAAAAGDVFLQEVIGYRGAFVDSCGTEVGEAFPFIAGVTYDPGCCRDDLYSFNFQETQIPAGAIEVALNIVTKYGEIPYGRKVIIDDNTGAAPPTVVSRVKRGRGPTTVGATFFVLGCWLLSWR